MTWIVSTTMLPEVTGNRRQGGVWIMNGRRQHAVRKRFGQRQVDNAAMRRTSPFGMTPSAGEESGALFRKMAVAHVRRGKALIGVVQGDGMPVEP